MKKSLSFISICLTLGFAISARSAVPGAQTNGVDSQRPAGLPTAPLLKDIDSLGGNEALFERARAVNAESRLRVVQDRIVSRSGRWEFAPALSGTISGDSYNRTSSLGLTVQRHLSPLLSVGLRYDRAFNKLTPEGENMVSDTAAKGQGLVPDIDYPKSSLVAVANVYPFYGKLSLLDRAVAHFDFYGLATLGSIELKSGRTTTYGAGGGVAVWLSRHWDTRLEAQWQRYRAQRLDGPGDMNVGVVSWQVGYLL